VQSVRTAPVAEFLDRDLAGDKLLVFLGPIVGPLAFAAREFYEAVL
jgi:hypothetical protein